jgi:hypothetical protein
VTVHEHISADNALFLVALDESDAEKRSALVHAAQCPSCADLIRESQALLQLVDSEPLEAEVNAALEARIVSAVFGPAGEPAPTTAATRWQYVAWLLGATLSALLIAFDAHAGQALYVEIGLRCLRLELAFSLVAVGAGALWTRRMARDLGALPASVVAMTGALIGQTVLRVSCEAPHAALHLVVFHFVGVLIATALGGVTGKLLTRAR